MLKNYTEKIDKCFLIIIYKNKININLFILVKSIIIHTVICDFCGQLLLNVLLLLK